MEKTKTSKKRNRESYLSNKGKWPSVKSSSKNSNPVSRRPPATLKYLYINGLNNANNADNTNTTDTTDNTNNRNNTNNLNNTKKTTLTAGKTKIKTNPKQKSKQNHKLGGWGIGKEPHKRTKGDTHHNSTRNRLSGDRLIRSTLKQTIFLSTLISLFSLSLLLTLISTANALPSISINTPQNNSGFLHSTDITFNFTATGDISDTIECSLIVDNNVIYTDKNISNSSHISFTTGNFSLGKHIWYVNCTDKTNSTNSEKQAFDILAGIYIEHITPGARIFIDNTEHQKGDYLSVPCDKELTIDTLVDEADYTDKIHIKKSLNLSIYETNQTNHTGLDNQSIYIFSAQDTTIDLAGKDSAVIGLHTKGNLEIKNTGTLKVYGLIEAENLTLIGSNWDSFYINNINAKNIILDGKSNTVLIEDAAIRNDLNIISKDIASVTILRLVSDGCVLFNDPGSPLDWAGSFNIEFETNDDMMFPKSKYPKDYDFSPYWFVNGKCKNYLADNNHTSPTSYPSVFMNLGVNNYGVIFNTRLEGSIYLDNDRGAWYSINLLGPLIETEEFLIDDSSSSPDSTEIIFYGEDISGNLPVLDSMYDKDTTDENYYSKNIVMDSGSGRFAFGNAKDNDINLRTASSPQDIIFLSGSDTISFEAQQDNTWNLYISEGSHWIVEDKPIEILWDYPEFTLHDNHGDEKGTWNPKSEAINITSFDIEHNNHDITIKLNTTDEAGNVYLLHRKQQEFEYALKETTKNSGLWQATFSGLEEGYHEIIGIATQNAGIYGKAHRHLLSADYTPPEVSLHTLKTVSYTNTTTFSAEINAKDNLAKVLKCRANVSGNLNNIFDVLNNTDTIISAASIPEGTHTFNAVCSDDAGNSKKTHDISIVVDRTKPALTPIYPLDQKTVRGAINITAEAHDPLSGIESVTAHITDSADNQIQTTLTKTGNYYTGNYESSELSDGTQAITVTATDNAGNTNNSAKTNIIADNTAPRITITPDKKSAIINDIIKITLYINQSSYNKSTLKLTIIGDTYTETTLNLTKTDTHNTYIARHDTEGMPAGTYEIKASVEDETGNKGENAITITISEKETDSNTGSTDSPKQDHSSSTNPTIEPENNDILISAEKSTTINPTNTPDTNNNTGNSTSKNPVNITSEYITTTARDAEEKESAQKTTSPTGYIAGAVYSLKSYILITIALTALSILIYLLQTPVISRMPRQSNNQSRSSSTRTKRLRKISQLTGRRQTR